MLVSWNWLQDYVKPEAPAETVAERLMMAGLNLESIEPVASVDGDLAVDLEVTSNRPDCLGHIGVAREASVLFGRPLTIPPAQPKTVAEPTAGVTSVAIECPDLCPRYVARVVRGVKIGPSPAWLQHRLQAVGVATVNNVVDITNYVLMECGQPLHAFDFDKLHGRRIVVRRAKAGEKIVAIDQREYPLDPQMCVIADADRPVAIGGVMGGFETEIGDTTTNVLVEAADFASMSIRSTARKLNLHSPSSYRFERGVDAYRLDWASRRCCELILEIAGGELLNEPVIAGTIPTEKRAPITLRLNQIPRLLGIDVPADEAITILESLGLERVEGAGAESPRETTRGLAETTHHSPLTTHSFTPPSWRRDLEREVDLIEEVARIHGYDKIPENVPVPLQLSAKTHRDRVTDKVRHLLTAAGFYEAVTLSFVTDELHALFTPPKTGTPLRVEHSSRRERNILRQSLVPSLLESRRENERHGTFNAQLFEIARTYLEAAPGRPERDVEPMRLSLVTGKPYADLKGVVEALARGLNATATVTARPADVSQFAPGRGAELLLDGKPWGWIGELDRSVTDRLDLQDAATVAELDLAVLEDAAQLIPQSQPLSPFPAMARDLNFVLDEGVTWEQLEQVVRRAAGPLLEAVSFAGQYRGKQIPADKKSYLLSLSYRSAERTLTAEEVDAAQAAIIESCQKQLAATLR